MARVTGVQKHMLLGLATEFYPRAVDLFGRGPAEEITAVSEAECALVRSFMEMIVDAVGERYPEDEDRNDDAILAVNIGSRIISEFAGSRT